MGRSGPQEDWLPSEESGRKLVTVYLLEPELCGRALGSYRPERKERGMYEEEPWRSVSLTKGDKRGRQPGRGWVEVKGMLHLCLSPLRVGTQQPGGESTHCWYDRHCFVHSG